MPAVCVNGLQVSEPSTLTPSLYRLKEIIASCSRSVESVDPHHSYTTVSELAEFLNSISDAVLSDPNNESARSIAFEVLSEVHRYICSSSLNQAVLDALSFELPKSVAKFAGVSYKCMRIADCIVDHFIVTCSPRDMLSILCEALHSPNEMLNCHGYFTPLLCGLSKVILSIQRRHFEQVKVVVPVILNVLKAVSLESDEEDREPKDLFERAIEIANSVKEVSLKLDSTVSKKLRALLALFVLQIMALVSSVDRGKLSSCLSLVVQLSYFLPYCDLSYIGCITGNDIETVTCLVLGGTEDEDYYMNYFSLVKDGASVAVIWGHIFDEVAKAAKEDISVVKDELQKEQLKRWHAIVMMKHIFSSPYLSWELKKHALDFLHCIADGAVPQCNDNMDHSSFVSSLFFALQAIQTVIMYAPDAALRKDAFDALKRVLADIPGSSRFDILKALIANSNSPSMGAILLDLVKEELYLEIRQQAETKVNEGMLFWNPAVLKFVKLIMRPPRGGPPSLPEDSDAVLSALNLYRFLLITESTGKTNYTGVMSKSNLSKAYNEWLLPLRTLLTGIMAENRKDCSQLASDTICALNPVEFVLYRCVELVEERLKHST